jgi:peptide/nickel transport system substrate-binding protein
MKKEKLSLIAAFALIFLLAASVIPTAALAQPAKGPYVDEIIFFLEPDESKAIKMLDAGDMHLYLWPPKKIEDKTFAEQSPNIGIIKVTPGLYNLQVNPVPTEEGFNPFSIKEVREALNLLIDREFIAKELMKGFAIPHITLFHPQTPDYARVADYMKIIESQYQYDPDKAKEMIFNALGKAGAVYRDGKWYYKDEPIVIKFVIRTEDIRRDIGSYVAIQLEKLGFEVDRVMSPAAKAIPLVYGGDPTKGQWHLYTEGWAFIAITAYDDTYPEFMFVSPYSGRIFEFYQPSPLLVDLATKLSRAEYKNLDERNEWIKKLTKLTIEDSARVWLVAEIGIFAHHKSLTNVVYDLFGGAWSRYSLRSLKFTDKVGGTVKVGVKAIFASAFNPVGGLTWLYEEYIRSTYEDMGVWYHPHTGRFMPVRAQFKVETKGPDGTLSVPADALKYNTKSGKYENVGDGVTATSKVTFDFAMGKWHHGQDIKIVDILAALAHLYEVANPDSPIYDIAAIQPVQQVFIEKFKGIKIIDKDTVEVYIDYWHPDETFIAYQADVWVGLPWEVYAVMDKAIANKELAWTDSRAEELGVEWLDLAKGPSIPILKKYLDELKAQNFIPKAIEEFVTADEAKARWDALANWYSKMGHFQVSNGPFYFVKADTVANQITVRAFRDYVYPPNRWDELVIPKVPEISLKAPAEVAPGVAATFTIRSVLRGVPYDAVDIKYMVVDPTGNVVLRGAAIGKGGGEFTIELSKEETSLLIPGTYELLVIAVGREAALPRLTSATFTVIPQVVHLEEIMKGEVGKVEEEVSKKIAEVQSELAKSIKEETSGVEKKVSASISDVEKRLREQIAAIESRVRGGVSESIAALEKRIAENTADLEKRIVQTSGDLEKRIISVRQEIASDTAKQITTAIEGAKADITASMTERISAVEKKLTDTVDARLKEMRKDIGGDLQTVRADVNALSGTLTTVLGIVIVAIVIGIVNLALIVKKR